jgi:DNA replication protein DnaC
MRLSSNFADMASVIEAKTHTDYLEKLLTQEVSYREHQGTERRLKAAGFYKIKTLDGYSFDEIDFPETLNMDDIMTFDFVKTATNIILYGGVGTGKTHLSTAIGVAACKQGLHVKFYRTAALVNRLSEAKKEGTLSVIMKKMDKADVLILDEWGYVPFDRTGGRLLFELISECYERKPIILNTNLEFSRWANILYDEQMTAALLDRLLHHCHLLQFPGTSIRLKESSIHALYKTATQANTKEIRDNGGYTK